MYLKSRKFGKNMSRPARVRCEYFENVNKHWLEEKERICTLCAKNWGKFKHYEEVRKSD